ncbi:MAG: hypothetical protein R2789_10770 [Microthrixaceae bacterium]
MLSYNVAGLPQDISGSDPETNLALISPPSERLRRGAHPQEDFDWWQPLLDGLPSREPPPVAPQQRRLHPYRSGQHPGPYTVGLDPTSRPLLSATAWG